MYEYKRTHELTTGKRVESQVRKIDYGTPCVYILHYPIPVTFV